MACLPFPFPDPLGDQEWNGERLASNYAFQQQNPNEMDLGADRSRREREGSNLILPER